ncbi:MAG TPA: hypothetical protein VNH15_03785 [Elusimicrobiota bacterium]|nr:hypothetical protein [Elusimicrobiota bacterium]
MTTARALAALAALALLPVRRVRAGDAAPPPAMHEASATARQGPVRLTLRIYDTILRRRYVMTRVPDAGFAATSATTTIEEFLDMERHSHRAKVERAQSAWYQLEISNKGKSWIAADQPFDYYSEIDGQTFAWGLDQNVASRHGIYLEAVGPDGRPVPWTYGPPEPAFSDDKGPLYYWRPLYVCLPYSVARDIYATRDFFKSLYEHFVLPKAGVSYDPDSVIDPNESIRTPTWAFHAAFPDWILNPNGYLRERAHDAWLKIVRPARYAATHKPPVVVPGYAELWGFKFDKPGVYKIWAVYDERPRPDKRGEKPDPAEVYFRTPAIKITVLP